MNDKVDIEYVKEVPVEEWVFFADDGTNRLTRNVNVISVFVKNHQSRFVIKDGMAITSSGAEIPFIDIRMWYLNAESNEWRPTKKGVRFNPSQWAIFRDVLSNNPASLAMDSPEEDHLNNLTGYQSTEISDAINRNATKKESDLRINCASIRTV